MKKSINIKKLLLIHLFIVIFIPSITFAADDFDDFKGIKEAQEEFNKLETASDEASQIIDEAIKELGKATDFVKNNLNNSNKIDENIKALEFIERSIGDVVNIIPAEFSSDMSNVDLSTFKKEDMKIVSEITNQMKSSKEEKFKNLVQNMLDLSEQGLNSFEISDNLNKLGVDTIKVDLRLLSKKDMETWNKNDWANSWKGEILTDDGNEIITDDEIKTKVVDLENKLQQNSISILEKRTSLTKLKSKVDPLNLQIDQLNTQKASLLSKYNAELIKQTTNVLTDKQINESKKISEGFSNNIISLTQQIVSYGNQSAELNNKLNNLNLELSNEITSSVNLTKQINSFNNELQNKQVLISKRELELEQLKKASPNLDKNINDLNQQFQKVKLERDFIQTDLEKSIDLEVEALKYYHSALGDSEEEIDFAMREVGVILDSDPRKARAFELEKWATYAGFSNDYIDKATVAIQNDDWETQKKLYEEVSKKLAKNPDWVVDIPNNSEINVFIAEDRAIQEASFLAIEGQKIKEQVNKIIDNRTSSLKNLASLNTTTLKYAATWEGMPEHKYLTDEFNKIISNSDFSKKSKEFEDVTKKVKDANQWLMQANNLRYSGQSFTQQMEADFSKKYYEAINGQNDLYSLSLEVSRLQGNSMSQSRTNLVKMVEDAKNNIEKIRNEEIAKNPGYNYADDINKILDKIPSFDTAKRQRANEVLTGIGHTDIWFGGVAIDVGDEGAALRAALGEQGDYEAYQEALKAMSEIGEAPVSEYMTGPYWEMTNVKAAAIVRSKKYDWVDDYAYINAYYEDPLNLTTAQRQEAEAELMSILGEKNPKLNALNKQVTKLSNEIEVTKNQSLSINKDLALLDNEIKTLRKSEQELNTQISDLTKQFNIKENLVTDKKQSIEDLQKQLNPINNDIKNLETRKNEVNSKLDQQINTIAMQIENQGVATTENKELKDNFENQIAQIDQQLLQYQNNVKQINTSVSLLNNELNTLEINTPDIKNQISELNNAFNDMINIKADLAISKADELGLKIEKKVIEAVAKLENKSLISINGTSLMRIVDTDILTDESGNFKTPVGTLTRGNQIFTAGDLDRESLFSVEKIDAEGDLKLSISKEAAEKINSGVFNLNSKASMVATSDMGQGIYTLIDPKTGRQVMKDGRGYHGGIVCSGDVCGPDGIFGKKALSEGFVYVMQTQTGGTMCSGAGDCTFNIGEQGRKQVEEQMKGDLSTNSNWGNSWEGLTVNTSGINTVSENLKSSVSSVSSSIKKSTKSVSLTISKTELNKAVTKSTSSLSFLPKGAFKKGNQILKPVSAGIGLRGSPETQATTLQGLGSVEKVAAQAASSSQAASEASEAVTDTVAEVSKAVEEVAKEVASNVEEVAKEVASVAKEVSGFVSGNDLKGISELANNALGAWVLVNATTGKQVLNADGSTKHGGIWAEGSLVSAEGSWGKKEAAKGNVYIYVGSATPCAAGDCEFDPDQLE